MNSFAVITSTFGSSAPDVQAPTVEITYPPEGAQVTPGFVLKSTINDDRVVTKAELRLDGALIKTLDEAAWNFVTPASLSQGAHRLELTAYDRAGNTTKKVVNVAYGTVCTQNSECDGAGYLCLDGHCVAGPDADGGLGSTCSDNSNCISGQCASDTDGNSYCVEGCDPSAASCPGGFSCLETGPGAGVCWPADGDGGGCNSGRNNTGVMFLALTLFGLVLGRRRRRSIVN